MDYIIFKEITKTFGYEKILNEISFKICSGEKVGLIGNNGCGKTTVFKIILGLESYDKSKEGKVIVRKDISIGYLEQETQAYSDMSVMQVLRSAFSDAIKAMNELEEIAARLELPDGSDTGKLLHRLDELQNTVQAKHGYEIDDRIKMVSTGLGVSESRYNSLMSELSGGERTRVFLARLLLEEPDVLLLDEPTNHLDLIAVDWLEKFLTRYQGTVITISHDRIFLDNSVNRILEIEGSRIFDYPGNYSFYKAKKAQDVFEQEKKYTAQQKEIKRLDKAAKRMREWAKRADNPLMFKKAVNIERRIEHMDKVDKPLPDYQSMKLDITNTSKSGREIIRIENLRKAFNGTELFKTVDLLIRRGEKVVISGENGCGKTTLLNIMTNKIEADSGLAVIGSGVSFGMLPQEIVFEDPERTILDEVRHRLTTNSQSAQRFLASFGFKGEHVMKRVSNLSGGEQKRLRLCTLMKKDYNLLIMDEPTNHMDIGSREILEEAINDYTGTCLFISHDRYFIKKTCKKKLLLSNGSLNEYENDYTELLLQEKTSEKKRAVSGSDISSIGKKAALSKNKLQALNDLENTIARLEEDVLKINDQMHKTTDYDELCLLMDKKSSIEKKLDVEYESWHNQG